MCGCVCGGVGVGVWARAYVYGIVLYVASTVYTRRYVAFCCAGTGILILNNVYLIIHLVSIPKGTLGCTARR